jgi:DNA polymerase III alpha subunit (gram-positive type)
MTILVGDIQMPILVGDIETDAIYMPRNIWMVGILDYHSDIFTPYYGDEVATGLLKLMEADITIGHNWRRYDVKNIERMTKNLIKIDQSKIIDTLELSRKFCKLTNHKLSTWGKMMNFLKEDYSDFSRFDKKMIPYCERDCRLTKKVFDILNEMNIESGYTDLLEGFR